MTKINKEGWEIKTVGEIATVTDYVANGSFATLRENVAYSSEPSFAVLVRLADFTASFNREKFVYVDEHAYNFLAKSKLEGGEIIMSNVGSLGKMFICPDLGMPMTLGPNTIVIRTENNRFFFYVFSSPQFQNQIKSISSQTALPKFNKTSFKKLQIPLPPLPIQQRIVEELDEINAIISAKKQQLSKLDELAQSIFYNMFGDPVANEKGWEVKKFKEFADAAIGLTYKPDNVVDDGVIVLRSGNIQDSKIDLNDLVRVNAKIPDSKYVKDGDILMCTRNGSFRLVGKVAMIKALPEQMTYGAFMTIIRSKYNPYLFQFFKTPVFRQYLVQGKTTTVNQITVKMLQELKIPLPPLPLQETFAARVSAIEEEKAAIAASIEKMQTLLDARMQEYFG